MKDRCRYIVPGISSGSARARRRLWWLTARARVHHSIGYVGRHECGVKATYQITHTGEALCSAHALAWNQLFGGVELIGAPALYPNLAAVPLEGLTPPEDVL